MDLGFLDNPGIFCFFRSWKPLENSLFSSKKNYISII